MTEHIRNKNLYKIFLGIIKYIPMILSIIQILGIILNYFRIFTTALTCIGGVSLIFLILLYLMSIIFRYCYLYRLPLYYLTASDLFFLISNTIFIPALDIYRIHAIIIGIFMIVYIIYAYLNRNKPKVDPIKNFCERYCNC